MNTGRASQNQPLSSPRVPRALESVSDLELVQLYLHNRSEKAFTELVERYQLKLHGCIHKYIQNEARVEEIVQETFLKVYCNLERFNQEQVFSTWIFTIAKNLSKNELRYQSLRVIEIPNGLIGSEGSKPAKDRKEKEWPDPNMDPFKDCDRTMLMDNINNALTKIPTEQRQVIELYHGEGLSYEEVAAVAHTNVGTVKSRINRGKGKMIPMLNHLRNQ